MKKHKYPEELVYGIMNDPDYWFRFFRNHMYAKRDHLFLPKRRRNGDLTMKCPLHNEVTPSLRINAKNNCFKCFGCGKGGNSLVFLQLFYKVSFFESIEYALQLKSQPIPLMNGEEQRLYSRQLRIVFTDVHPLYLVEDNGLPF